MQAFATTCEAIAATTKKLQKTALVADYLRSRSVDEAAISAVFLSGRPFPVWEETTLQVGGRSLWAIVAELAGKEEGALTEAYRRLGDLGAVAGDLLRQQPGQGVGVLEVESAFRQIAAARGAAAKTALVRDLISRSTPLEAKYVVKIMEWTANAGKKMFTPTDKQVVAAYSAITGYNPTTGANDNGAVEIDVLNYWRQTGIAGHKIGAYVALEPSNHNHIMDSVFIFEGCYIGLQLPISAQAQTQNHQVWSVPPGGPSGDGKPGSWGGHAVPVVAYDSRGVTVVTWGDLQRMTWSFWETYCEEAYAILSNDYLTNKKTSPQGFKLDQLQADLHDLK